MDFFDAKALASLCIFQEAKWRISFVDPMKRMDKHQLHQQRSRLPCLLTIKRN